MSTSLQVSKKYTKIVPYKSFLFFLLHPTLGNFFFDLGFVCGPRVKITLKPLTESGFMLPGVRYYLRYG